MVGEVGEEGEKEASFSLKVPPASWACSAGGRAGGLSGLVYPTCLKVMCTMELPCPVARFVSWGGSGTGDSALIQRRRIDLGVACQQSATVIFSV